jgi:hypothetical protein
MDVASPISCCRAKKILQTLIEGAVQSLRTAVFRAREAKPSAANPGRALGRRRIFIFRVCGAGAAGVRRLDLWGLCRQQRIATTWTWASGVLALRNFRLPSGLIASALNLLVFDVFSLCALLFFARLSAGQAR